jgi:rhamnosyltransferase
MRVSIVIRTLNEQRHLGALLAKLRQQITPGFDTEVVVIDSGSTDATVSIAKSFGCRITQIAKHEFSFGRSLNRGCAFARGDVLVFISGHCVPVDETWLNLLCKPVLDGTVSYSYGRQIGDDDSNFSERRVFSKYFTEKSMIPQDGFFCNNANSALSRTAWEQLRFDEEITGLEDMELAKRLVNLGQKVGYVADAAVFHHHSETWAQVRRRFQREAMALQKIMPEIHLSRLDTLRYIVSSTIGDWRAATRNGVTSTSRRDMFLFRYNQYLGSYIGNNETRVFSRNAKERFFYPLANEEMNNDASLKPMRRVVANESQQPKG